MTKELIKKRYAAEQVVERVSKRRVPLMIFFAVLLSGALLLIFEYKRVLSICSAVSGYSSRVMIWMAERKTHLHHGLKEVKQINETDSTEQPVHFEFYTALPTMQVSVPEAAIQQVENTPNKAMTLNHPIVSVEELERELSNQLLRYHYVLQLGVFRTFAGAQRYQRSHPITKSVTTTITEVFVNQRKIYRLQTGPFANLEQARLVQRRLRKKGMNVLLKKPS
jgi:hypothetical protein